MSKKIGRNDPCPCGSGKKYKKCCGAEPSEGGFIPGPDEWFPESERTGTIWDDYMELLPPLGIYAKKISQFDIDGKEFDKAVMNFEKQFRPGERNGIPDSLFVSWMYFDLRFGTSRETVAERMLADPIIKGLHEPGPTYLRHMSESYLTFFEIIEESIDTDSVVVEELGTGERFTVLHVRRLLNVEPVVGEVWYARRMGFPDASFFYTTPYIFENKAKLELKRVIGMQRDDFSRSPQADLVSRESYLAESQKESAVFWAAYILEGMGHGSFFPVAEGMGPHEEPDRDELPVLVTTDGEEVVLTEIHFRIRDEAVLRKRLSRLRSFEYCEHDKTWTWLKARSRKYPDKPRSVLGGLCIKGEVLIAETSSRERAARLRSKLKRHLGELIAYSKTMYQDPYDFPELSPEEIDARKKRSDELNALPEVQDAMRKHLEQHYLEEWPTEKLPALGGKTPLQAVKNENGRAAVIALIDDMDGMQDSPRSKMPRIDFDKLRRKLGLPPRAN